MLNQHGGNIIRISLTYGLHPKDILDFSANINPLGFPPAIEEVITSNIHAILHYPDPECLELKSILSRRHLCDEANIIIGNGSTELFYLIPRAFAPKTGFIFQPTFSEFTRALRSAHVAVEEIICNEADTFNVHPIEWLELLHSATHLPLPHSTSKAVEKILFLCNPNNPTGQLIGKEEILHLSDRLNDTLIVVDEAFMDFIPQGENFSVISYAPEIKNLIVVRSLTKFFGIPGIRLGFLVAHKEMVDAMMEHKEPWTVNSLAQLAGRVAVCDKDFASKSIEYINKEKLFLFDAISKIKGIAPFKPSANFILVKITAPELTAPILCKRLMMRHRIAIRDCANFVGLSDRYFRVAVRKHDENIRLVETLNDCIHE